MRSPGHHERPAAAARGHLSACGLIGGLVVLSAVFTAARPARAQAVDGISTFEQRCASCHTDGDTGSRAPNRQVLKQMTPEAVFEAITTGAMRTNAEGLTEAQRRVLAEQITGHALGTSRSAQASAMQHQC